MASKRKEETAKSRRERQPLGVMRKKMTLNPDTMSMFESNGLVPRWINDDDNGMRITNAVAGGYDFISSDGTVIVGDSLNKEDARRRVSKNVGTFKDGSPKKAYLMAIKKEFYDEDQEKKEETNMMVDDAIRGGNPSGLKHHGVSPEMGGASVKKVQYNPAKARYKP